MPRAQRICFLGALYHVYQRGNNKQDIFVDDTDRWHMLKLFLESKNKFDYLLHCYALMKNHFHITIETPNTTPISKIMHYIDAGYAAYFNARHGTKGHLFQGRFKTSLVEKDHYLLELSRYVHLNPVKTGLVPLPEDYIWSSYRAYIGHKKDVLVDTETVLEYFDARNKERAQREYRKFVEGAIPSLFEKKDWIEENLKRRRFIGSLDFVNNYLAKEALKKVPGATLKSADPYYYLGRCDILSIKKGEIMTHEMHRRTNYLVKKNFQLKYTIAIVMTMLAVMLISGIGLYVGMWSSIIENFSKFKVSENLETAKRIAGYEEARYSKGDFRLEKIFREAELLSAQERNTLHGALKSVNKALLPKMIILVVVIFIGGIFVSHGIAGPMYRFEKSARAIRDGDLRVDFNIRRTDDMRDASSSLGEMAEALRADIKKMKILAEEGKAEEIKTVLSKYKI